MPAYLSGEAKERRLSYFGRLRTLPLAYRLLYLEVRKQSTCVTLLMSVALDSGIFNNVGKIVRAGRDLNSLCTVSLFPPLYCVLRSAEHYANPDFIADRSYHRIISKTVLTNLRRLGININSNVNIELLCSNKFVELVQVQEQ